MFSYNYNFSMLFHLGNELDVYPKLQYSIEKFVTQEILQTQA